MHVANEEAKNAEDQKKAQEMEQQHAAEEQKKAEEHKAAADAMGKSIRDMPRQQSLTFSRRKDACGTGTS